MPGPADARAGSPGPARVPVGFTVLGPLTAVVGGRQVALGGPRQRGVLARLLVARGRVVPVERLIDDLWSGRPPAKAAASLQAYVSNLRRLLEPERGPREPARLLLSRAPGYALEPAAASAVDAWDFESRLRRARELLSPAATGAGVGVGRPDGPLSRAVQDALALWRGPVLAEFADQPWALAEIGRLDELRLSARELAVEAALAEGRPADAVPEARELAEGHPLREQGWRLLALALWGAGRQAEALDALRAARALLTGELGLDPHPALTELESAILNQRTAQLLPGPAGSAAGAAAPSALPSAPPAAAAPDGVPALPAGRLFVGREGELRTLRQAAREAGAGGDPG
ncbi:BTAD domain-containing putative transcriptional regulator, partial [Kitasatospora sp. MBT63]|uniref:AfsR/SARP family transcriptional regulator n=1 Tax=Kitasatospora sp. MBT63 TaxID=1444768 RepID=UPI0018F45B7B